ncbi:uncharacterized protein J3D65DRAFT_285718 [Phyllosticta citribraziliensis]|uniref:Uncharacterized protein n=1 Tax=Phyllosticta citribraziliensis TaxID=989973 RepID=A0ABR1LYH6_9PEZI
MEPTEIKLVQLAFGGLNKFVPIAMGTPYTKLVKTAYSMFKQEPDKVTFALYYDTNENAAVDEDVWNCGEEFFFSDATTARARKFYCAFTPIDASDATQVGGSGATERHPSSPQADVMRPPRRAPAGVEVVRSEAQPRRRASLPTSQDASPRTHKRPRVLSPNHSGSSAGRRATNPEAAARGPRHRRWTSAAPQSPHSATRTRQGQAQRWSEDTSGRAGCHLQTSVTAGNDHESGPAPTGTPEKEVSALSSPLSSARSSVSPPEWPGYTSGRAECRLPASATASNVHQSGPAPTGILGMRASASSSPLSSARSSVLPPDGSPFIPQSPTPMYSRKSVRAASMRANSLIIETIEKDHHDGPDASATEARPEHGAPNRKYKKIDVTFHFENKMGYHPHLKFQSWKVTYPGDEDLKEREEQLRNYIDGQLYMASQRLTQRQRQGIMGDLEIFIYVYYCDTDHRVDMLHATNHHQLWEFLRANIKDSESAKLGAAVTLHRKQDVEMKILNRLSPTSSPEGGGDDDDRNIVPVEVAAGRAEQHGDGYIEENQDGEEEQGPGDASDNNSNAGED